MRWPIIRALVLKQLVAVATLSFLKNVEAYQCMNAVFGGTTNCNANDVKFDSLAGFRVFDSMADPPCNCNCGGSSGVACTPWNQARAAVDCSGLAAGVKQISCWAPYNGPLQPIGTVFGACLGSDDNVNVALKVNLLVGTARYDVALYINNDGGSATTGGQCSILPMSVGTYGTVTVATTGTDTDGDACPDFTTTGTLTNFEFPPITLKCADQFSTTGSPNGLLDFDVGVSWQQTALNNCDFSTNNLPKPGTSSKCWVPDGGARIELPIYVPPYLTPTAQPSLSSAPSSQPSLFPSVSSAPSVSHAPSLSTEPSLSAAPSSQPSISPTESAAPSGEPSSSPSVSMQPTLSSEPSSQPSTSPSKSAQPSSEPSSQPTVSMLPSVSLVPSSSTDEPSASPSTSKKPSQSPSLDPTASKMPSSHPTGKPTDQPSFPPTGSPYYPDWMFNSQVCINDGAAPEYMKTIQAMNYIYKDKQECCETHFSWRVRQCMGNDSPVYYRDGPTSTCKKGETRDDYDVAFDTLKECCENQVYWDVYGCMQSSPKVLEFEYSLDFEELVEPLSCQEADTIAKRIEDAMDPHMPSGTTVIVVGIGAATISGDIVSGTTSCGGSLAGQSYQGAWSLTADYSIPPGITTSVKFHVSTECSSSGCTDAQSVKTLYDTTYQSLFLYAQATMTQDIIKAAGASPAVPQLQHAVLLVDATSMTPVGTYTDPRIGEDTLVDAASLTVQGVLTLAGFDTSSFDSADETAAMSFFQAALETTLESIGLSTGSSVKVTDIVDGKILYEIILYADTSAETEIAAASIETSLASVATRNDIAANAVTEASGSSLAPAFGSGFVITANTETATIEVPVAKVTIEGEFATSATSFGAADEPYLEEAIYNALVEGGAIPEGSIVEVTGYLGGVIQYKVNTYLDSASDVKAQANKLVSTLSQTSTMTQIASEAASIPGTTLSSMIIFAGTHLSTVGVPSRGWWPDWDPSKNSCEVGGKAPAYMNQQYNQYFSSSKRACCEKWFPYNLKNCIGDTTEGSKKVLFLPNWKDGARACYSKLEGQMEDFELADSFGTLDDCCKTRFSYSYAECCSVPGLGGCKTSTQTQYYPKDGKCVGGIESNLKPEEKLFAYSSMKDCCSKNFWWRERQCLTSSG